MKNLYFLILIMCLSLHGEKVMPLPTINVWSGREQSLSFIARDGWRLEAEHGRLLANGQTTGAIKLTFPVLTGKEQAILFVDGQKVAYLAIHPMKLLDGISADCRLHGEALERLGVRNKLSAEEDGSCFFIPFSLLDGMLDEPHSATAKYVVFTERRDFPINIRDEWTELSVGINRKKGTFSVIMEKRERIIDNTGGGGSWIVAHGRKGEKILLLPPEFDLEDVNNILLIKMELEK